MGETSVVQTLLHANIHFVCEVVCRQRNSDSWVCFDFCFAGLDTATVILLLLLLCALIVAFYYWIRWSLNQPLTSQFCFSFLFMPHSIASCYKCVTTATVSDCCHCCGWRHTMQCWHIDLVIMRYFHCCYLMLLRSLFCSLWWFV